MRGAVRRNADAAKAAQAAVLVRDTHLISAATRAVGKPAALFRAQARTPATVDDPRHQARRASRFGQLASDLLALAADIEDAAMPEAHCFGLGIASSFALTLVAVSSAARVFRSDRNDVAPAAIVDEPTVFVLVTLGFVSAASGRAG